MGEEFGDFGLSRHKVDKHKFNSRKCSTLSVCVYFEFDLKFIKCQVTIKLIHRNWFECWLKLYVIDLF